MGKHRAKGFAADSPLISVVIPVYNEKHTILEILERVRCVVIPKEMIVVDDFSTDGTREILQSLLESSSQKDNGELSQPSDNGPVSPFEDKLQKLSNAIRQDGKTNLKIYFQAKNSGKGAALRRGFAEVTGDIVIIQDADLEYSPTDYPKLIKPIMEDDADVVYGSRFLGESRRVLLFWHTVGNKFLTLLSNVLTDLNLTDMETGYKVFRSDILGSLQFESDRFGFEPEFTVKVAQAGYRIFEVPISYKGREYWEGKKITWKDGLVTLWCLLKFRFFARDNDVGRHTLNRLSKARRYNRLIYETIRPDIGHRVLEVGAGIGNISRFLVGADHLILTEIHSHYLRTLKHVFKPYPHVSVRAVDLTDATSLRSLQSEQIDTVICLNVVEHITEYMEALENLYDVLTPGGKLIMLVPAHQGLYSQFDRLLGHVRRYRRNDVRQLLSSVGFECGQTRYFNILGYFGWLFVNRLMNFKRLPHPFVKVHDWLTPLLRLERFVSLPFGLSILAVAQKPDVKQVALPQHSESITDTFVTE